MHPHHGGLRRPPILDVSPETEIRTKALMAQVSGLGDEFTRDNYTNPSLAQDVYLQVYAHVVVKQEVTRSEMLERPELANASPQDIGTAIQELLRRQQITEDTEDGGLTLKIREGK
ncbi:MAG: hypothetical protein HY438_04300 [DPANN group archaeon]|nr:hypothetical protein [DPANN group archaeon]